MKILRLDFLPHSTDLGLLLLRLWVGLTMTLLHGWAKLTGFNGMSDKFIDLLGLGSKVSLGLAISGEFFCSVLLIFGLFTRFAALGVGTTMAVAFMMAHNSTLKGAHNGELAFVYLGVYLTLFLCGGGRFSLDARLGGNKLAGKSQKRVAR